MGLRILIKRILIEQMLQRQPRMASAKVSLTDSRVGRAQIEINHHYFN